MFRGLGQTTPAKQCCNQHTNHSPPRWQLRMSGGCHRVPFKGELEQYLNWRRAGRCESGTSGSRALSHRSCHHNHLGSATPAGGLGAGAFFFSFQIAHKGSQLPVQQPSWRVFAYLTQVILLLPLIWPPVGKDLGGHALKFLPCYDYIIPIICVTEMCGGRKTYTVFL